MGLPGGGRRQKLQFGVGPFLAGFPIGVDMFSKLASGRDLLLGQSGPLGGEKARPCLAFHCLSQAEIRAVAGLGIIGASAGRLAALDSSWGKRATTHRLWLSQFGDELADTGWDFRRSGHGSILRRLLP